MMVPPRNRICRAGLTGARAAGSNAPPSCLVVERCAAPAIRTAAGAAASAAPIFKSPRREIDFTLTPSLVSHIYARPAYLTRERRDLRPRKGELDDQFQQTRAGCTGCRAARRANHGRANGASAGHTAVLWNLAPRLEHADGDDDLRQPRQHGGAGDAEPRAPEVRRGGTDAGRSEGRHHRLPGVLRHLL